MTPERRSKIIAQEKAAWTKTIAMFADVARLEGYTVISLEDGAWKIQKDEEVSLLSSDSELYLYLVDRNVLTVKLLRRRPGVGE